MWQVKSCSCLCFDNHLGECAIFFPPLQSSSIFAQLPPRRAALLFYFIQDDGKRHEKPCGKSKVHYLIFATRNVSPLRYRVMEEMWVVRRGKGKKRENKNQTRPPCFGISVANLWMKSWKE